MFHYSAGKKSGQDKNKNSAKFLDPKKDIHTRLKALIRLLELTDQSEVKQFFQEHSTEVFYLFYEEFTNLELNAKSKGTKLKEELEELLALLEKIFINLADLIHSLWQFNCIGLVLRKLLHHGNVVAVREQGVKLFMLWLLILQEKVDEFNLAVFGSIVPGFPSPIEKVDTKDGRRPLELFEYVISCVNGQGTEHGMFNTSLESEIEWCVAEGGNAICPPQQGDKIIPPEDLTKKFLDQLLYYMTSHMLQIQWNETHMRESGFYYIFAHFKRFYLPEIFPLWDPIDRLYDHGNNIISVPITEYPDKDKEYSDQCAQTHSIKMHCQSSVLGWLIKYTAHWINKPKPYKFSELPGITNIPPDDADGKEPPVEATTVDEEKLAESAPIVRYVLYATKENVLLVHEIFRQAFLMPLSCSDIMVHVLNVYKEWFFKVSESKPLFMLEPKITPTKLEEEGDGSESTKASPPSPLRPTSCKEAVARYGKDFVSNVPVEHVCAGFHANLRLFIALSGQVFFVRQQEDILSKHADICKKVMKHYRNIVLDKQLDALTWRQLLIVLLKIIDHIFTWKPPSPRYTTLGGQLGSYLLQTLFVTWVRASLEVYLTLDLWDELLRVGSTFTCWEEMIKEWAGTMETLTRVMARTVYGIDLNDPPLSQLTQRGNLRKIKKNSNVATTPVDGARRSLSSGWTRFQEPGCVATENLPNISEGREAQESTSMLAKATLPRTSCDVPTSQSKQRPSSLKVKSSSIKRDVAEATTNEVKEDGFADEFVPCEGEGKKSNEYVNYKFESRPGAITCETPQQDFADFASHFPETSNFDADSECDSEFGDSEHESNGEDVAKNNLYEALNDNESVSSSLNIPLTYNLVSIDSFLSESSQNLLGEEYDPSDNSDPNKSSENGSFPSLAHMSAEDGNEIIAAARCIVKHSIKQVLVRKNDSSDSGEKSNDSGEKSNDSGEKINDSGEKSDDSGEKINDCGEKSNDCGEKVDDCGEKILRHADDVIVAENTFIDILKKNKFFSSDENFFSNEDVFNSTEDENENNHSNTEENNSLLNENNYDTADEEKLDSDITESGTYTGNYSDSTYNKNCESDIMKSGTYSDSTYNSDEHIKSTDFLAPDHLVSPRLSGQDLINFEIDLNGSARQNADNQSIDSHMFTSLIDNESFSVMNTLTNVSDSEIEIGEAPIAEKDMEILEESIRNVHFEGADPDNPEKHIMRSESFKSPDSSTRSVIEGGAEVGWTTVSSVILWNRVLGILGNVNDIKDQEMHGLVFKNLIELWQMLEMIKSNQGISMDNKSTPLPSALTPPLYFCSTWCLQAMAGDSLSSHKQGRIRAFRLMCMMMIRNHGLTPSPELMTHFFRLLHVGLTGQDQDVINAIVAESALFYTREFEGSSCLSLDFIHATNTIISTQYMHYPRKEAISLLGSMICLAGAYPNIKIYQPGIRANETQHALTGKELREKILIPVLKAAKNDPSTRARCVALSCLGLFIVESLIHWNGEQRIYECLALIISSLEFHSQTVCAVALDVLVTLTYYHKELSAYDKDLPLKIVEALSHITVQIHSSKQTSTCELKPEEAPEYISRLLLCLLDWLMVIPHESLLKPCADGEHTYIGMAMKTYKRCCEQNEWYHLERNQPLNINQIFVGDARPIRLARVHHDLSMDDTQGVTDDDDTDVFQTGRNNVHDSLLQLTAKYCISEILNYYEYFPFDTGAVQPVSVVLETDDHMEENQSDLLVCHNVQFLLLNGTTLLSVAELPQVEEFHASCQGVKTISRFIQRDVSGKYCWDVAGLFNINHTCDLPDKDRKVSKRGCVDRKHSRNLSVSVPRLTTSCSTELPTWETVDPNVDRVDQLLRYIGHASPECLLYPDQQLNIPSPVPDVIDLRTQSAVVTAVLKEHNEEENYVHEISHDARITASEITQPEFRDPSSPFHFSRLLLHQFNYFSWENRPEIELLERNEKLLRDIKNLDKRPSRETQKIAIFYVGPGQEDKHSILSNSEGSKEFEDFVAGMGWEVDLATHTGFMGGLEKNLSTGPSAPYFATHSLEVIFHVSTRMPGSEDEELKTKLRHLGNDEIHIVWSEHHRDFRRGIINTEFGDVLIIIYPMKNNLYRIHIDRDPKIPPFGPLYDGVIVDGDLLPHLVRCAAINAGRTKRATLPFFNRHYEERARCIREIAASRVHAATFEDFATRIFSPCLPAASEEDMNSSDGVLRTASVPSRAEIMKDSFSVLKLLDIPDKSFRERSSTSITHSHHGKTHSFDGAKLFRRSMSNSSLLDEDAPVFLDSDQIEYKTRRRSEQRRGKR